ncbi:hypothetical protein PC116_g29556 [Phytophthora cactorum]|nr:hypothetical protein PC116_g29556 [Phytophthora cactorum]
MGKHPYFPVVLGSVTICRLNGVVTTPEAAKLLERLMAEMTIHS